MKKTMEKQVNTYAYSPQLIMEYLEEKFLDHIESDEEYSLYLDYRRIGLKAIKLNKINYNTYRWLVREAREIFE